MCSTIRASYPGDRRYGALSAVRLLPSVFALTLFLPQKWVLGGTPVLPEHLPWLIVLALVVVAGNVLLLPFSWSPMVPQVGLLTVTLASCGILLLHPNGVVYALPFWTARLAVRLSRAAELRRDRTVHGRRGGFRSCSRTSSGWPGWASRSVCWRWCSSRPTARAVRSGWSRRSCWWRGGSRWWRNTPARRRPWRNGRGFAREVHDVLAHSLAGLSLTLQGTRLMLQRDKRVAGGHRPGDQGAETGCGRSRGGTAGRRGAA
ncbi:histidine kinase dimerization/phosphoacceptor domain-containing protein [Kutzneria kofuensis]|uniref:histidine kinase dimerization/phosphoacceptor domain-containing protein n=1 Tax=Kutzneria kofuensis TaxID=103725 RepID=UPI0031F081FB